MKVIKLKYSNVEERRNKINLIEKYNGIVYEGITVLFGLFKNNSHDTVNLLIDEFDGELMIGGDNID